MAGLGSSVQLHVGRAVADLPRGCCWLPPRERCRRLGARSQLASRSMGELSRAPGQPGTASSSQPAPLGVVLAAGGTGGHVFPAIAIADAIRSLSGDKASISFIGGDRLEASAVPNAGYELHRVPAVELARPLHHPANLLLPLRLAWACLRGVVALLRLRPQVVIGTGGYTAFPACVAAVLLRVPLILQGAARFLRSRRVLLTGNPVRRALFRTSRSDARERLFRRHFGTPYVGSVEAGDRVVTILGGSLGATGLNSVVERALALLPDLQLPGAARLPAAQPGDENLASESVSYLGDDWVEGWGATAAAAEAAAQREPAAAAGKGARRLWVVWQTGQADFERISGLCSHPRLAVTPFVAQMDELYHSSDLVISSAGAITCSELMATGSAALLLPSPTAAEDHQSLNAEALEALGAAAALPHGLHTPEVLAAEIGRLLADEDSLLEMRRTARREAKADSAQVVAAEAVRLASEGVLARARTSPAKGLAAAIARAAVADAAATVASVSAAAAAAAAAAASAAPAPAAAQPAAQRAAGGLRQQPPRQEAQDATGLTRIPPWKQQDGVAAAQWLGTQMPASRGEMEDAGRKLRKTIGRVGVSLARPGGAGSSASASAASATPARSSTGAGTATGDHQHQAGGGLLAVSPEGDPPAAATPPQHAQQQQQRNLSGGAGLAY